MLNFNMETKESFSIFKDNKQTIIVESYDNKVFEVSKGKSLDDVRYFTTINAISDNDLNQKLKELFSDN